MVVTLLPVAFVDGLAAVALVVALGCCCYFRMKDGKRAVYVVT